MNKENIVRIGVIGAIVSWLIFAYPIYNPFQKITISALKFFLTLIKIKTTNVQNYIVVQFSDIKIFKLSIECAGVVLIAIFLIGIFITPNIQFMIRLLGLLFVPIIFLANIARIMMTIIVADYSPKISIFVHNSVGQLFILGVAVICYVYFIKLSITLQKEVINVT